MALAFTDSGSGYIGLGAATALELTGDMTVATWLNPDAQPGAANQGLITAADPNDPFTGWQFTFNRNGGYTLNFFSSGGGGFTGADTAWTEDVWEHAAYTAIGATGTFYKGGVADGSVSHTAPAGGSGADKFIAATAAGVNLLNGRLAEMAVWNVGLIAAEVAALSKGFSPSLIRPTSLVAYWSLNRPGTAHQVDHWKHGLTATVNGVITDYDHPRVIYPSRRRLVFVPSGAVEAGYLLVAN